MVNIEKVIDLKLEMDDVREEIKQLCEWLLDIKDVLKDDPIYEWEDRSEEMANIMLAYRHLEDARMRCWKVIQALQWENIYDKK